MPIEKLEISAQMPSDLEACANGMSVVLAFKTVIGRLNEVIEAVNQIQAYLVPTHPDSALDRIDAMLFEQPPESVQQEKGHSIDLEMALEEYAWAIRESERHPEADPNYKEVACTYQAVLSAAQREYSQNRDTKNGS